MRLQRLLLACLGALAIAAPVGAEEDRVQIGLYAPDLPLVQASGEPEVKSVVWDRGDLEVRLTQAAPCGNFEPVDPFWEKAGTTIVLRFGWIGFPNEPQSRDLCLKHVRAWVFRVPNQKYGVLVSDYVPRYRRVANVVSVVHE